MSDNRDLSEASGIDVERDVLGRMDFEPIIRDVRPMPAHVLAPPKGSA